METGTVSHATLRPEDLIPAFMSKLEELNIRRATQLSAKYVEAGWPYAMAGLLFGDPFTPLQAELAPYILEDLFDALNEEAPSDHYFGAHPGDGSDFGFWKIEEDVQDENPARLHEFCYYH